MAKSQDICKFSDQNITINNMIEHQVNTYVVIVLKNPQKRQKKIVKWQQLK